MKYRIRQAVVIGLLVLSSGCLMVRPESQPMQTYQLSLDADSMKFEARQPGGAGPILLVAPPQSAPGFDTPRMVYLTRPYEVSYFSANQWVDSPSHMLFPLLVMALEQSGVWRAVVTAPVGVRADYRADVSNLVVAQEFLQTPSRIRISWSAQVSDLHTGKVVGSRRFDAVGDAPSEDAYGGVRAANQILGKLLNEMASWLGGCVSERGKAAC